VFAYFKVLPAIFLESLSKTVIKISQDVRGQDAGLERPEYKSGALILEPTCLVEFTNIQILCPNKKIMFTESSIDF
jgi:hypothetical protein